MCTRCLLLLQLLLLTATALAPMRAGSTAAAVNAASLAVMDAGIPMHDFLVACTAGMLDRTVLLGARVHLRQRCVSHARARCPRRLTTGVHPAQT